MTDEERLADAIARTREMSSIDANLIEDALDAKDREIAELKSGWDQCRELLRLNVDAVDSLKVERDAAYARGAADMREAIAAEVEKVTPRTAKAIRALPLPQNQSAACLAAHQVIASNRK